MNSMASPYYLTIHMYMRHAELPKALGSSCSH